MTYDQADRLQEIYAQIKEENEPSPYALRLAQVYDGFSQPLALFREQDQQLKNTLQDYDRLGRLIASSDFLGRVTTMQHADYCTGNLTTTARGVEREVSYDERCRLREVKTQDEVRQFEYDELNRLIVVTLASRYAWPQGSPTEGSIYAQGYSVYQTRYRYDSLDRVVEVTYPGGETVSYSYDVDSNLVQLVDIHGKITEYDYYADGRLLSVTHELQHFEYTYDAVGRLDTVTYPPSTQLVLHHSWDDDGRLESLEYRKNNQPFQRFDYTYDDSGNRISMVETNPSNVQTSWVYGYDWLNRLTSVSRNGQPQLSYTYDESDNRRSMTLHPVNEIYTFRPDVADQLEFIEVSVNGDSPTLLESFVYDLDGNLETRTKNGVVTRYVWDTHNQLRQIRIDGQTMDTALYDHEGVRRLQKDSQGQQKAYSSGGMSLADQRPSGPISFLQGHQLLGINEDGQLRYFITDALSSVRLVVDDAGNVLGAFAYDAFGVPDTSASPPPPELRGHSFQGGLGVRNEEAGLYYARRRWYASDLGRWLSADPIGFSGGLNLFTYVENNPIGFVDPDGLYVDAVYDVRNRVLTVDDYALNNLGQWQKVGSYTFKNLFSGDKNCKDDPRKEAIPSLGPVPRGKYLISPMIDVSNIHPELTGDTGWFLLLNPLTHRSRVTVAGDGGSPVKRDSFFIHPGRVSQGCITFPSDTTSGGAGGYPRSAEYSRLKAILQNTAPLGSGNPLPPVTTRHPYPPTWGGGFPGYLTVK